MQASAARIEATVGEGALTSQRMFGGVAFLLGGHMLCRAPPRGLLARVGAEGEAAALALPHASPCLGTGRRMTGFVMVDPPGFATDRDLARWLDLARAYVETLPPKPAKPPGKGRRRTTA